MIDKEACRQVHGLDVHLKAKRKNKIRKACETLRTIIVDLEYNVQNEEPGEVVADLNRIKNKLWDIEYLIQGGGNGI